MGEALPRFVPVTDCRLNLVFATGQADIARTVKFLASEAPFITGEVIAVDGGRFIES
jgi:NAD(P)-dependent dehydrogenase (short-subunit alcohol dehydrogenase family)